MFTLFSIPKPFKGNIGIIQTNAIKSWLKLSCEIILLGDDEGVAETASELGVKHVSGVTKNEYGTPLLDSAWEIVESSASHNLMVYSNTDIILMSDFISGVRRAPEGRFLMVGQRWDVELNELVNFDNPEWEAELRDHVARFGALHPPTGSDYFVFPRRAMGKLPPFIVGRPGWDNWLIYHARSLGMPVIDATRAITVIHQNHGSNRITSGVEVDNNLRLVGGSQYVFTLADATYALTSTGLERISFWKHLNRSLASATVLHPRLAPLRHLTSGIDTLGSTFKVIGNFFKP
jgi:hypothetical protein